jgi:hypothetical protein
MCNRLASRVEKQNPTYPDDYGEIHVPVILPVYLRHFTPMKKIDHWLHTNKEVANRIQETEDWLRKEKDFSSRIYICDCGEPLCRSGFAWIKDGAALFVMSTGCDRVINAWIYPFHTDCF